MPLQINQLNCEPYITESIMKGLAPKSNYVFCLRGFDKVKRAAKNYYMLDAILNSNGFDRKLTVDRILHKTNDAIKKYTHRNTKDVINMFLAAFENVIDRHARQMKTDKLIILTEIQPIIFHVVLFDIIGYDSSFRACIPWTQFSSLIKNEGYIVEFINDILYYMISRRVEFHTTGQLYKVYASVELTHNLRNGQVNKIWNQEQPAKNG
jgi:hypothetical protein